MESCCRGAGEIQHLLFSPNTVDKRTRYDNRTSLYCGIPSYRYIVTNLYRTQKYLFQDAKKKETVQFNVYV